MRSRARSKAVSVALGGLSGLAIGFACVTRTTLRSWIVPESGAEGSGWLLTSLPTWAGYGSLLLLLPGVLGLYLGRKGREGLVSPFAAAGLSGAIFVPGAFALWPFLASFSGRFLDFILLAAGLSLGVRWLMARRLVPTPWLIFALALAVYLAAGMKTSSDVGLSGDEPHYVLIAYSLLHDGDLAVQNNYGDEDFRTFYAGAIGPHLAEGSPHSIHGIGLPLLLFPGFAAFGLTGVLATEAILAAALAAVTYGLSLRVTGHGPASLVATLALGLTAPGLFLAVSAYPELPAALVVALVLYRLSNDAPPHRLAATGLGLLSGLLPFLHMKFVPLAAVLSMSLLVRYRARKLPLVAGVLVAAAAFLAFSFVTAGSLDPTAAYGRQRVFLSVIPLGLAGLLFDQEFGLITNAPVYILGFAGLSGLVRRASLLGVVSCLVLAAVALPGAAHPLWSGGTSPPARFLFPALPALACALASLVASRKGMASWAPSLLAVSLAVAAAMLFLTPQPLFLNGRDGASNVLEALSSSWALTDYEPSLTSPDIHDYLWALGLAGFLIASLFQKSAVVLGRISPVALALALTFVNDVTLSERTRTLEPTWNARVMHELGSRAEERFLALPSRERLAPKDVMARVSLPLERVVRDGDPRFWWSRSYNLPPGTFDVEGVRARGVAIANGNGILLEDGTRFTTEVALWRFRLRARELSAEPRVRLVELPALAADSARHGPEDGAFQSIALEGGGRLHSLDEGAYLDPVGFWIAPERFVSFYFEPESEASQSLDLAAGPIDAWLRLETERGSERFRIPASGRKTIAVPRGRFTLYCEDGFRPSEHVPGSDDSRALGVLLATPPAFDLSR